MGTSLCVCLVAWWHCPLSFPPRPRSALVPGPALSSSSGALPGLPSTVHRHPSTAAHWRLSSGIFQHSLFQGGESLPPYCWTRTGRVIDVIALYPSIPTLKTFWNITCQFGCCGVTLHWRGGGGGEGNDTRGGVITIRESKQSMQQRKSKCRKFHQGGNRKSRLETMKVES